MTLVAIRSWSATNIVSCDFLSISNAAVTAATGDTVMILPGSCIITNPIVVSKSITLSGSGTNQTTLISGAGLSYVIWLQSSTTNLITVHDINMVGDLGNGTGFLKIGGGDPATPAKCQYHVYNIQMTNCLNHGMNVGYSDYFGLIEYCSFILPTNAGDFNCIIVGGNEYLSWSNAIPLGTLNNTYIEHCYFQNQSSQGGNGFYDGYTGAQLVVRWNAFDGTAATGCHGYDSQVTSTRSQECYGNTYTNVNYKGVYLNLSRGGLIEMFSNTIWAGASNDAPATYAPKLQYYRAVANSYQGHYGYCGVATTNYRYGSGPLAQNMTLNYTTNFMAADTLGFGDSIYTLDASLSGTANHVLLGADLTGTLTNLMQTINMNSAYAGTLYSAATTSNTTFTATGVTNAVLWLWNKLDGTNQYGYPAAMQEGVWYQLKYTNYPVYQFGCYSCSNLVHLYSGGTTNINFNYADPMTGTPDYMSNILVINRDYFQDTLPAYTPFGVHPLSINQSGVQPLQWVIVK